MTLSHSQSMRQPLHLHIDPFPLSYNQHRQFVSPESSPSSSSARASLVTNGTTPSSTGSEWAIFSVLCLYDFASDDPDHLPFSKNEILDIVKEEDSGWWAAMRRGVDVVGWIPQAFVQPLSEEMAERLRGVKEDLRVFDFTAEELYNSAPVSRPLDLYSSEPELSPSPRRPRARVATHRTKLQTPVDSSQKRPPITIVSPSSYAGYSSKLWPYAPPSPTTPMPQPPFASTKATPLMHLSEDSPRYDDLSRRRRRHLHHNDPITSQHPTLARSGLSSPPSDRSRDLTSKSPIFRTLDLDNDGNVRAGTVVAFVDKLSSDPLTKDAIQMARDTTFRNIFLMTFRTFMTAQQLFEMLIDKFTMEQPDDVPDSEYQDWKDKVLFPTQRRILTVFTIWLEDHRMLEEEPNIAQHLSDFLSRVVSPAPLATTAKLILQSIQRLTFASPTTVFPSNRKGRKSQAYRNDLLRMDPVDMAEQLSLLEFKLYAKISPQEAIAFSKSQTSKTVANLCAFCATHDKLASWVKMSILTNEAPGRRADTIDFWIKVAEKCRNFHNFSSMSALINALSSTAITRLLLSWAHVNRKSNLDALLKHNEPTGGFSGYRALLNNVEGSCVPFIGMFLTDIVHIQDQFQDQGEQICFLKRQRWFEAVSVMLRYQSRPYNFPESESTLKFIETHMRVASVKDQAWFWARSQEVQQSELAHADIRKGLEAAGF